MSAHERRIFYKAVRFAAVSAGLAVAAASAQAPVDVREALVIGNSAYASAPLENPANDALAMSAALRKLGFSVQVLRDADKKQLTQAFDSLGARLKGRQGVAMVYYAGHGVQVNYDNFLVPVDARIRQEADIASQAVNINQALESLAASGSRLSVMVLDACRDNPFKTRQAFVGLAPRDAPKGTLIAYATDPGNVAQDGDASSGNGLYTQFLLKELARPLTTIDDVFKRVRFSVRRASGGQQIPSYTNGLNENFSFERGFSARPVELPERSAQFAVEKARWDSIRNSSNPGDFYEFIEAYPNSGIGELAQAVLERLERRKIVAQGAQGEAAQNPAESRFRLGDTYKMQLRLDTYSRPELFTIRVTEVNDDRARYTGVFGPGQFGESTVAGAVISDGTSTFDPPYVLVPGGEYQVGKRWAGRSIRTDKTGDKQWMDYSARVMAREKITVAAGTFETYKVEFSFQMQSGVQLKSAVWVQPEWGIAIKTSFQYQDRAGVVRLGTRELVERQRGS